MKKNLNCLCGGNFSIDIDEEIDIDSNPEYLEKIFNGTFMSFVCPHCGKKHKPEHKLTVQWKSKKLKLEVLPELDRGEFYLRKKDTPDFETVIGFPEMADRLAVIKDDLEPVIIETLKSYLLAKAEENYPDNEINVWYHCKGSGGIEFHLDGIRADEVAVMRVPLDLYEKTREDYRKHPKNDNFTQLRVRSYLSIQNLMRPNIYK